MHTVYGPLKPCYLYVLCVIYCMSANSLHVVPCCHSLPQVCKNSFCCKDRILCARRKTAGSLQWSNATFIVFSSADLSFTSQSQPPHSKWKLSLFDLGWLLWGHGVSDACDCAFASREPYAKLFSLYYWVNHLFGIPSLCFIWRCLDTVSFVSL